MYYQPGPFVNDQSNPVRRAMSWLVYWIKRLRGPMQTPAQRLMAYFESMFIDDGFLSLLSPNRHRVSDRMLRSAQPYFFQVGRLAKKGVKTIVNLRGARDCASFYLEEMACCKHGIKLLNFPVESRQPPKMEVLEKLEALFAQIEYPALMHCKAGSDRAGLMSALYLLVNEKRPVAEAKKQLGLRFGHVKQSKTGVLDRFFDTFEAYQKKNGGDFMSWVRSAYDRDAIIRAHKTNSFAEWLYNKALRRE
jgi:protein tyrosine/serine phosphatase